MVLDSGIFSSISGFIGRLFGSGSGSSIWSSGGGSISQDEFQNFQLSKFKNEYAYQNYESEIKAVFDRVQDRQNYESSVKFLNDINQQKIDYLESQIQEARNFSIPAPAPVQIGALDRSSADFLYKGKGSFENLHPISQQNILRIQFNQQQSQAFAEFTAPIYQKIQGYISNLSGQKSLLESREFI